MFQNTKDCLAQNQVKSKIILGVKSSYKTNIQAVQVFAQRLKEARLRAGHTQEQLGILAGIDEFSASARMNQYEKGKHMPDFDFVEKLALALNVPAPYFYARDDNLAKWILSFDKN